MLQRSTSHPDSTFEQRLAEHKASLELKAARLKPGPERDEPSGKPGKSTPPSTSMSG